MNHWQHDFGRVETEIVAVPAGHVIYPGRVLEWAAFYDRHGYLPSVLLTSGGWMVNGHHRLIVAREKQIRLHGLIVERDGPRWVVTGNLCLVR